MINSQDLINALDEYEMKLCQKYPNCRDCPCNVEDLAYGSDKDRKSTRLNSSH